MGKGVWILHLQNRDTKDCGRYIVESSVEDQSLDPALHKF